MISLKKIYKLLKLLKFKLWRKGLLNGIAATVELEDMIKNINPENPDMNLAEKLIIEKLNPIL